jgi:hypothetical protein
VRTIVHTVGTAGIVRVVGIAGVAALAACDTGASRGPAAGDSTAAPTYALSDTVPFTAVVGGGSRALLHRNGAVIDTVDVAFGVQRVGRDSVIFLPVRSDTAIAGADTGANAAHITEHVVFDGATRTLVKDMVPHFDSRYSSPAVLAGALYYWGIFESNGIDSVQAVRYEFARRRLNALPLPVTRPATADRFFFTPPFLDGKEFVFKAPTGEWRFRTPRQR